MIEKNETRIKNASTQTLRKHEYAEEYFYSCKSCGNAFVASPPDDIHKYSSIFQCWKFDWLERIYECPRCSKTTTLYWHAEVHKYRDYATAKEVAQKMSDRKTGDESARWFKRTEGY